MRGRSSPAASNMSTTPSDTDATATTICRIAISASYRAGCPQRPLAQLHMHRLEERDLVANLLRLALVAAASANAFLNSRNSSVNRCLPSGSPRM